MFHFVPPVPREKMERLEVWRKSPADRKSTIGFKAINLALGKNFNDFINEYRISEVARIMQDPACDHIILVGIAYDCGLNSKSTLTAFSGK